MSDEKKVAEQAVTDTTVWESTVTSDAARVADELAQKKMELFLFYQFLFLVCFCNKLE